MGRRRKTRPRNATSALLRSVAVLSSIALGEGLGVVSFGPRLTSCGTSVARVGPLSRRQMARQAVAAHGDGMEPGMAWMEQGEGVGVDGAEQPWQADGPTDSASLLASFKVNKIEFLAAVRT